MRKVERTCRSCNESRLDMFLDLGRMPLADRLLSEKQLDEQEPHFPLEVAFCPNCSLVQILETVDPEVLFCEEYPYYSSFSTELLEHSRANVMDLIKTRKLDESGFVIEVASNDGYLLKNYAECEIPVLGIDPADGPAFAAQKAGIPTLNTFFTEELAQSLRDDGKRADIIHANNVLAHVADTNGFVEGLRTLLKDDGVIVIEVPYVRELIDNCEFDTIYHEHLCYFSVTALDHLFRSHGLYLNEVKILSIHGGSLRLYIGLEENVGSSVKSLLESESRLGMDKIDYYIDFARKVDGVRQSVIDLLEGLKSDGKKIAAYGAAAKGSTLINYMNIGPDLIDFVVDRNVHKQGKFMPGKHIPISSPERIVHEMPDYVLLLPWNFKDEILSQQKAYMDRGGRFIVPIPEPEVI